MPIDPTKLMRDRMGVPLPPSDIQARLTAYDKRLGMRYLSASWAITWTWKPDDPRRATVRSGETPLEMAFDIVGWLPITCSLDEAPAFLERNLKSSSIPELQALSFEIAHYNHDVPLKHTMEMVVNETRDAMGKADEVQSAIFAVTPTKRATKPKKKLENTLG